MFPVSPSSPLERVKSYFGRCAARGQKPSNRSVKPSLIALSVFCGAGVAVAAAPALAYDYPSAAPTSIALKATSYGVPSSNRYFVAPSDASDLDSGSPVGSASSNGSQGAPWTIEKAFGSSGAPANSTLVFRGGTYRVNSIDVTRALTLQAYPGEAPWIDGSRRVTSWAKDTTNAGCWYAVSNGSPSFELLSHETLTTDYLSSNPMAGEREMVFVNDLPRVQVGYKTVTAKGSDPTPSPVSITDDNTAIKAMATDEFYLSRGQHRIVLRNGSTTTAPTNVEITASLRGLYIKTGGVTVRGLGFRRFGDQGFRIAGSNATIENCTLFWNGYTGIAFDGVSDQSVFRGNVFTCNGRTGMRGGDTDNVKIEGNTFNFNNVEGFAQGWDAAGFKVTNFRDGIIRDNLVENNYSAGMWLDISCLRNKVYRNVVRNNSTGIFFEISSHVDIAYNLCVDNGTGIMVSGSSFARLYNNTLSNNGNHITIKDSGRKNDPNVDWGKNGGGGAPDCNPIEGPESTADANAGADWTAHDNTVINSILSGSNSARQGTYSAMLRAFENGKRTLNGTPNYSTCTVGNPGYSFTDGYENSNLMFAAIDYNAYWRPSTSAPSQVVKWYRTASGENAYRDYSSVAAFNASEGGQFGQPNYEANGIMPATGGTNPFFLSSTDYRLKAGVASGAAVPSDIVALANTAPTSGFEVPGLSSTLRAAIGASPSSNYRGAFVGAQSAPATPTSFASTSSGQSSVGLSWNYSGSSVDGFKIERSANDGAFAALTTTSGTARSYSDTSVDSGTYYKYRVQASNSASNSGFSGVVEAVTVAVIGSTTVRIQAENFVVGANGTAYYDTTPGNMLGPTSGVYRNGPNDDVDIASIGAGEYAINYGAAGEWTTYAFNVTTTGFYDVTLRVAAAASDRTVTLRVDSSDIGTLDTPNTGAWTTYGTVTLRGISLTAGDHVLRATLGSTGTSNLDWIEFAPATPATPVLAAAPASRSSVTLTWTHDGKSVSKFEVEQSNGSTWSAAAPDQSSTSRTVTISGLTPNTAYTYRVRAYNSLRTALSNTATARTYPSDPRASLIAVPANRIEAQNYDVDGEGVGYHDSTPANDVDGATPTPTARMAWRSKPCRAPTTATPSGASPAARARPPSG